MTTLTENTYRDVIDKISKLGSGDMAILRRCNKNPLEDSKLFPVLGRLGFINSYEKSLVVCLYAAYHRKEDNPYYSDSFNFGKAFQEAYNPEQKEDKDIRFRALLTASDKEQLSYRLRQAIKLLKSQNIKIDFSVLLKNLYNWNSDKQWVQRKWAEGYYKSFSDADTKAQDIAPDINESEDSDLENE
ncbi:type I-E CRISPR-associated protein Cse2/CasB [Leptospira sp. 85282-16]|uniref:type I-E CRISPR-associated protein Cse2/CasB n=1 Tax=Leptospira sp. 85282-16 TaxID=2971256 RepID=UPI0021BFCD3F|nr:type I-E CRISPR-associated protein Cse2/CasB [Leptospira sp. 85282-16]MCT8335190.1 type I-E CRISPR-associated protein Cse2/CasB [Leptospira sp. 85282-16]